MGYVDVDQTRNTVTSTVTISPTEGTIPVNLTDASGNPSGTIANPIAVEITSASTGEALNQYNEVSAVASGSSTTVVSFTVPLGRQIILERISTSGENIATYTVLINGDPIDTQRTYFGSNLNLQFNFTSSNSKLTLNGGDIVSLTVLHNRPFTGNFEGRIQMTQLS